MPKTYSPIKKAKASDLIVEEIWAAILNGELKPGEKLPPERELVEQFGVSKVTLREALQSLEANGYIERKRGANGGAIVLELTPVKGIDLLGEYLNMKMMSIDELINARFMIEPLITRHVAATITPEKAHQLELLLEKHQKEYEATGKSKFGWHFEQYLSKLTGNKILVVIEDLLVSLVQGIEQKIINAETTDAELKVQLLKKYYADTFIEHKRIAKAIIAHDQEEAGEAMLLHRRNWAETFRQLYNTAFSPD